MASYNYHTYIVGGHIQYLWCNYEHYIVSYTHTWLIMYTSWCRHVCIYACVQVIINILAPIVIRHGVRSFQLNDGQLQHFVECPGSIPFRYPRSVAKMETSFSAVATILHLGYHENLKSTKLTLYYIASVKKPKTF